MKKEISIGRSNFEELRRNSDWLYVDKTKYLYNLVKDLSYSFFFLSRQGALEKVLLVQLLKQYLRGKENYLMTYILMKRQIMIFLVIQFFLLIFQSFLL